MDADKRPASASPQRGRPASTTAVLGLLLAFAVLWVRTAWVSDDAYITFRTVENFLDGYGLRFNAAERVQTYTHPLWLLILTPLRLVVGEPYSACLALSVACTLLAVGVLAGTVARDLRAAAWGVAALALSKAFVDYSPSGLENPLSHAILALFFALYVRGPTGERGRSTLYALAALLALTRMDLALLVVPALVELFRRAPRVKELALGGAPFVVWEIFSVVYYGFPFPNTAYAKLGAGIPREALVERGVGYFASSLVSDPLTLSVVAAACLWVAVHRRREQRSFAMMLGVVCYLVYVVFIGGDFMAGRFFSAAYFVAVLTFAHRIALERRATAAAAFGAVLVLGLGASSSPIWSGSDAGSDRGSIRDHRGIADERAFYYPFTGLLAGGRDGAARHPWAIEGLTAKGENRAVVVRDTLGLFAYHAGPGVHVIDVYALADPLLARLPSRIDPGFRPGHFARALPAGYVETLQGGSNVLEDEPLARYYERLRSATRGGIFTSGRARTLLALNATEPEGIDYARYRYFDRERVGLGALSPGTAPVRRLTGAGLRIELSGARTEALLDMGLDCDDDYEVAFYRGETRLGATEVSADCAREAAAVTRRTVAVPERARETGYDVIWLRPTRGARPYRVEHVTLLR